MKKEGNEAIIASMEYGVYLLQGENLYDAETASKLQACDKWDRTTAHVVVFCQNTVFQIEGDEGKELPFSTNPILNGEKQFDIYEAVHMYDKEALELTRELAGYGSVAAYYAIKKGEGWFLRSLGQLMAIYHYKDKVNRLIEKYTEDSIVIDDWYWSCNQFSAANAWLIGMNYGIIYYYNNNSNTYRVRSISAIDLNTLTLHLSNTEEAE